MKMIRIMLVLSLAALTVPAVMAQSAQSSSQQAPPGTLNYVEGAVALDGQHLTTSAVGYKVMQAGQVLSTVDGRAEILLTPGVFLRLGHNSAVQMVRPDLLRTQLRVTSGRATVEVDYLYRQNHIEIAEDGVMTVLVKQGFYEFNANDGLVRTFQGRALVFGNPTRATVVRTSHQVMLPPAEASRGDVPVVMHKLRVQHFDRKRVENTDSLVVWSSLRSKYLSQANAQLAYEYAGYPGFEPGWYWDPWGMGYTWMPGYGMFWNPFGWGFYSPIWMSYGYPYYGGYGYGVASNYGGNGGRVLAGRNFAESRSFGRGSGGFQGGPARAFSGGGFHGGGAMGVGFHGGGVSLGAGGFGGGGHASVGGGHGR